MDDLDDLEFTTIATNLGLPAPGLALSDEHCMQMAELCRNTYRNRESELGVRIDGRSMPRLTKKSTLAWCPVITKICTYPIDEREAFDEAEHGRVHIHRPLFCTDLDACQLKEAKARVRMINKRKKKKKSGDRKPKLPTRNLSITKALREKYKH